MTDYSKSTPKGDLFNEVVNAKEASTTKRSFVTIVLGAGHSVSFTKRTVSGDDDGAPPAEKCGFAFSYRVGPSGAVLDGERLASDLAEGGALAGLLDRVAAGHSVTGNGTTNVGRLTEDAAAADTELSRLLSSGYVHDRLELWSASDYVVGQLCEPADAWTGLSKSYGITRDARESELSVAANGIVCDARGNDCVLDHGDVVRCLKGVIFAVRAAEPAPASQAM